MIRLFQSVRKVIDKRHVQVLQLLSEPLDEMVSRYTDNGAKLMGESSVVVVGGNKANTQGLHRQP